MKFLCCCLLLLGTTACSNFPKKRTEPSQREPLKLKIINYNLWFGLGEGFFKRKELEPTQHRQDRFQHQLDLLRSAQPDILFIQEVNPVASQTQTIAQHLNMDYVFQKTNCGVSFLNFGIPANLDMGISILVRPPLQIDKILGLKLSGPIGSCHDLISFQYGEFRYALYALAHHPEYGSFLLANTHFHHGPEWSSKVRTQIDEWTGSGVLTQSQKIKLEESIEESNQRRQKELTNLMEQITDLQYHYNNLPLLLAGDFNSTVDSPVYKSIIEYYNFQDSAGSYSHTPYTWNPPENQTNHQYTEEMGVSVPVFGNAEIEDFFKEYDRRRRRIDYIFVNDDVEILNHSLFADEPNSRGTIGSDHFGVEVLLNVNGRTSSL